MKTITLLLLSFSTCFAAAYTASVTGNWNNAATWGGAGIPVSGDSASINNGITVTVPSGYTAVAGTHSGTNTAISCSSGGAGTGILNINGNLTYQGDVVQCSAVWTIGPGAAIRANVPSGSSYQWTIGNTDLTLANLVINGSSGAHVTWDISDVGNTWITGSGQADTGLITATYTDFNHIYEPTGFFGFYTLFTSGRQMSFDHCTFQNSGKFSQFTAQKNGTSVLVNNSTFTNCTVTGYVFSFDDRIESGSPSPVFSLQNSVFDACNLGINWGNFAVPATTLIMNNVVFNTRLNVAGNPWHLTNVLMYNNFSGAGLPHLVPGGTWSQVLGIRGCAAGVCSDNPHWFDMGGISGGDLTITDLYIGFEGYDLNQASAGDAIQFAPPAVGRIFALSNYIGLPLSGTFINNSAAGTYNMDFRVSHNTLGARSPTADCSGMFCAESAGITLSANYYTYIKNNVFFGDDNVGPVLWLNNTGTVTNSTSYSGVDYNGRSGLLSNPYSQPTAIYGGMPVITAFASPNPPGTHDVLLPPGFLSIQRRTFGGYCKAHDPTLTTYDLCFAKFALMNDPTFDSYYTVAKLYAWLKAGFSPTNPQYFTAADDGGYLGATPPKLQYGHVLSPITQ